MPVQEGLRRRAGLMGPPGGRAKDGGVWVDDPGALRPVIADSAFSGGLANLKFYR